MNQTSAKIVQDLVRLGEEGDLQGIVQKKKKNEFWRYYQMVWTQTRLILENEMHNILCDFNRKTDHFILASRIAKVSI